jgi:hypothetical protein
LNLFTHILISKILYKHLVKKIDLDKSAFIFGNIKPDLTSKCFIIPHTLDNYLLIVCDQANKLISKETSLKEFSMNLGEMCHYLCDFFCFYHFNQTLYNKLFFHFIYEVYLHVKLYNIIFTRKLRLDSNIHVPRKNISSIVLTNRKNYFSRPSDIQRDIFYAFSTAIWSCESVFYFKANNKNGVDLQRHTA